MKKGASFELLYKLKISLFRRLFLVSLLLHLGCFSWLLFPSQSSESLSKEFVSLELVAHNSSQNPKLLVAGSRSGGLRPNKLKLSLDDIGLRGSKLRWGANAEASEVNSSWAQAGNFQVDALTAFEGLDVEYVRFIRSLWAEVDKFVLESPYLSEYGHVGDVYLQFRLSKQGEIIESSFRGTSKDPVLKVLAVRALRKALKNENQMIRFLSEEILFNARFSWADYQTCKSKKGTQKNNLSFCHYAEDKRKTFSTAEKTTAYLSALQYGPGVLEEIQKYNREEGHRKTEFDPFADLRRDPDWNLEAKGELLR